MDTTRDVVIEDLSKEDLIKKCKRLLLLAQKAKQAKDECADELKISQENENKLTVDLSAIQKESAETQNQIKILLRENSELTNHIQLADKNARDKDAQYLALQKTLQKLNAKISAFEIHSSEEKERCSQLLKDHENLLMERKELEAKNNELKAKLKLVEEKYALVDIKLVEFQDKYLEEKKKHAKLESFLLEKLEERTDKSSSDRSESREGLQTVLETQELETVYQKLDESLATSEKFKVLNESLNQQIETLRKELTASNSTNEQLQKSHRKVIEKCLQQCKNLKECCFKAAIDSQNLEKKYKSLEEESISQATAHSELKDVKDKLNNFNQEIAQFTDANFNLKKTIGNLENELAACKAKLSEAEALHTEDMEKLNEFCEKNKTLQSVIEESAKQRDSTQLVEVVKSQAVIECLNQQIQALRDENLAADNKFSKLEERLAESNRLSESLEAMVNKRCEEYDEFKQKVQAFDVLLPQLGSLWANLTQTKQAFSALKNEMVSYVSSLRDDQEALGSSLTQIVEEFASKLVDSNSELLEEMNMMNQALKERGEVISQLEEAGASLRADASDSDSRLKKITEKLGSVQGESTALRTQLEARDKTIRDMEDEIWRLRSSDSPADALSSSTISKVEESQRLVDIEESFEEKYNKLKLIAIKLKKKGVGLQELVDQERTKLSNERMEFQNKLAAFQTQSKTLNSLQADYDSLQGRSDADRREVADLRKALNKARDEAVLLKQSSEELKAEHSKFKQEKATFDMIKKELRGQIQSLKKDVEKEKEKGKDWVREKEKWELEFQAVEKKLEEEKERHKGTLANLEEERHKQKKQSLLSLEMADYERTVTDLSRKLDAKEAQIRELSASLATQRELSGTLQATVLSLEARVVSEQFAADGAKARCGVVQDENLALQTELANKAAVVLEMERLAQERSLELDALKLEASTAVADSAKFEEKYRAVQDSARHEVRMTEDKNTQLQSLLERKELELEELRKEFESYKVRAQSVLRQSQRDGPPGRQNDIEEEVVQLRASCDSLRTKLDDAAKKLQNLTNNHASLTEEKARLMAKLHELQNEVGQLNTSNAQLQAAEQRARELGEEAARLLPVQQETLAQCYRKEIEELEAKYRGELETARAAQQQAETALQLHVGRQSSPSHRRQPSGGALEGNHRRQLSSSFVPVKTERETLDVLMLEREACEGSESVDSSSPRVLPLDQLLAPQPPSSVDASQWAQRLEKCESRIQHLTTLLSDAEGDAARLQQLNQVLKEEIRRKERNVAREEHASNLEYLKNVVVKFATLPRGDERMRLIPVLNTILKLSREEEQRLCAAARGDGGAAGWGSYLGGMWSAPQ